MLALCNARMLVESELVEGHALLIDGARIAAVLPEGEVPASARRRDLGGAILAPGFVDIQVNGGGDALFNDDPSVATIRRIGEAHRRFGTTGFLPTLISDDLPVIRAGIAAVEEAIAAGVPGVLGIHIEGPFINAARKGIHDPDKIRALDEEGLAVLTSLRRGRTLVTLAPEMAGVAMVRRLAAAGVVVSAGHTAGSYAELSEAIEAGLTGFTHLFNAMSPLGSREPGAVGAALFHEGPWCSLIVDGHHVDPVTLRLALRCKPLSRFLLVTDAMPPTGGEAREFVLNGRRITAREGRLVDDEGTLAGADLDMMGAVRRARDLLALPLPAALAMASEHPAAFLRLDGEIGRLRAGHRASLVAIGVDDRIETCWIDGQPLTLI